METKKDVELVEEFNSLLEHNPIPKRYVTAIRLALRRYQRDYNIVAFTHINLNDFMKMRGIGPKALYLLWELYGKPEAWTRYITEIK